MKNIKVLPVQKYNKRNIPNDMKFLDKTEGFVILGGNYNSIVYVKNKADLNQAVVLIKDI